MPVVYKLQFHEITAPIVAAQTKFGGQPVWLEPPVTPRSRRTGKAMTFIGQVRVPSLWTGDERIRLAYLFMTGAGFDPQAMETWNPNEGETAVVLQCGSKPVVHHPPYPDVLQCWQEVDGRRVPVACEYAVEETPVDEPEYMAQEQTDQLTDSAREERVELWSGNKIGGSPYWIQGEELPYPDGHLLLQLEDGTYPFNLNLGTEPLRESRRLFGVSHAAMADSLSWR